MGYEAEAAALVRIRDLRFRYKGQEHDVLRIPALDIGGSGLTALTGPSGAGKSTLIELLAGTLREKYQGSVEVLGVEWSSLTRDADRQRQIRRIGLIPQDYALLPGRTAWETSEQDLRDSGVPKELRSERIEKALGQVGLEAMSDRDVARLSGGQRQRVAIARMLARDVDLVIADEPTANLDPQLVGEALALLRRLSDHAPVIVVTHDAKIAALCDRTVVLQSAVTYDPNEPAHAAGRGPRATGTADHFPAGGRAAPGRRLVSPRILVPAGLILLAGAVVAAFVFSRPHPHPAVAPGLTGEMAYVGDAGGLWVADVPTGGKAHEIVRGEVRDPSWSHDGKHIAFVRGDVRGAPEQIDIVNADGTGLETVVHARRREAAGASTYYAFAHPRWSADDGAIYYQYSDPLNKFAGGVMIHGLTAGVERTIAGRSKSFDVSHSGLLALSVQATNPGLTGQRVWAQDATGRRRLLVDGTTGIANPGAKVPAATDPTWSPDGKTLAVADPGVETVNANDGRTTRIVSAPIGVVTAVTWSPNGQWLAYARQGAGALSYIWAVSLRTGRKRRLFEGKEPAWSPMARATRAPSGLTGDIAYVGDAGGLWVTDVATGKTHEIVNGQIRDPAWSHDGTRIAFAHGDFRGAPEQIKVVHADGTGLETIVPARRQPAPGPPTYYDLAHPRWSSDDRTIYYLYESTLSQHLGGVSSHSLTTGAETKVAARCKSFDINASGVLALSLETMNPAMTGERVWLKYPSGKRQLLVDGTTGIANPGAKVPATSDPTWSPNIRVLALADPGVQTEDSRTGRARTIVSTPISAVTAVTWSANGQSIAYARQNRNAPSYIWAASIRTGKQQRLFEGKQPAWSPAVK